VQVVRSFRRIERTWFIRSEYRQISRNRFQRCADPRSSVKPAEIGRRSPPVGWFGRDSTLSSRQQANGFCDVPKRNSEPAILYQHLTI